MTTPTAYDDDSSAAPRTERTDYAGAAHAGDSHDGSFAGDANKDPITGQPGSHPVGTGLGTAAGGAAAGALGGAIAGPVGSVVGAVVGGLVGAAAGHGAGEAVNHTDPDAAALAEAEREANKH